MKRIYVLFTAILLLATNGYADIMQAAKMEGKGMAFGDLIMAEMGRSGRVFTNQEIYDKCKAKARDNYIPDQYYNLVIKSCLKQNGLRLR